MAGGKGMRPKEDGKREKKLRQTGIPFSETEVALQAQ